MNTTTPDLGSIAKEEAESIENADSIKDAGLRGPNVLDVNYTISMDGKLKGIDVSYNAQTARITVSLFDQSLTAGSGGETHTTHVSDDSGVLKDAAMWWAEQIDGVPVDA